MNDPKYTETQLQTQAAFAAWQLGRAIQYKLYGESDQMWRECPHTFPTFADASYCFRPAPIPAPRYWSEPAHIPGPVCWLRLKDREHPSASLEAMITAVSAVCFTWDTNEPRNCRFEPPDKIAELEYSTDRLNWKACLVQP